MDPNRFTLSQDDHNAHLLAGVMDATSTPGETAAAARTRRAGIVRMFRTFDPANSVEAMIACHCISLQFVLAAAMRDAGNVDMDPIMLTRMRASAMAISKNPHIWLMKFESLHTRNEARAAEARQRAGLPAATVAPPQPEPVPARLPLEQPRPMAAQPPQPMLPPAQPGAAAPPMPGPAPLSVQDILLSSAAAIQASRPNGRLSVAAATPVT
jgi:hypothetical protein